MQYKWQNIQACQIEKNMYVQSHTYGGKFDV